MISIKSSLALFVGLLLSATLMANDTVRVLGLESFMNIVRTYHPVVRVATIQVDKSKAEVLKSRGAFDPGFTSATESKTLGDKQYFNYTRHELLIPTWYGVDIKAGVDKAEGYYLNPESTKGSVGYVGVKVPANALFFDKRRAALQQAQAMKKVSEEERRLTVNDLIYEAIGAYMNWVREYQIYSRTMALVRSNEARLSFLKTEVVQGSRPGIDTIEALGQLMALRQQAESASLSYQNAALEQANYLWLENDVPAKWYDNIVPDTSILEAQLSKNSVQLDSLLALVSNHPKYQMLWRKMDALKIDKKLKQQSLLPKLSVSGSLLSKDFKSPGEQFYEALGANNKVGIEFSLPLLMREARGAVKGAALKIEETDIEKEQAGYKIENKIRASYNEFNSLCEQVEHYSNVVKYAEVMLRSERQKYELGESTLFMINARELKLLESVQKLTELKAKKQKAWYAVQYAAGILN